MRMTVARRRRGFDALLVASLCAYDTIRLVRSYRHAVIRLKYMHSS
jgi:hypothetical protein